MFIAITQLCAGHATFALARRFGDAPMQCDLSLLVTLQAAFINLSHAKASS